MGRWRPRSAEPSARPVGFEEISDGQAYAGAVEWAGKGPYVDALVDIWRAVREGRLETVTDGVKRVTGGNRSRSRSGPRRTPRPFSSVSVRALKRIHVDQYGADRLAPGAITREGGMRLVGRSVNERFHHAWKDKKHSLRLVEAVSILIGG